MISDPHALTASRKAVIAPLAASLVALFKLRIVALLLFAGMGGAFLAAGGWPGWGALGLMSFAGGLAAMGASALFLVSYLVYHGVHGDTKFVGQGIVRPIYFFVLITHIVLSAVTLPLVFSSFFFSLSGRFPAHKKVSKATAPLWLYVSVTGVLVFAMLKIWNP